MESLDQILRPLVRNATVVEVRKSKTRLAQTKSKFGGLPYFEAGESWPMCTCCTKPLAFICLFDLRQTTHPLRDRIPFFAFFYCWDCSPWGLGIETEIDGSWLTRIYRDPQESTSIQLTPPEDENPVVKCDVKFTEIQTLPDWEGISGICPDALELALEINDDAPWEAYREAVEKIVGVQEITTLIDGYPRWIQGFNAPEGFKFLAQIDSESEAELMWGDNGSIYLFATDTPNPVIAMRLDCY